MVEMFVLRILASICLSSLMIPMASAQLYGDLVVMGSSGCCSFGVDAGGVGIVGQVITTFASTTRAACRRACVETYDDFCGGIEYESDANSCILFGDLPLSNRRAVYCETRRCFYRIGFGLGWTSTATTSVTTTPFSTDSTTTPTTVSTTMTTSPITSTTATTSPMTTLTTTPITIPLLTTLTTTPITFPSTSQTSTQTTTLTTTATSTPFANPCPLDVVLLIDTSLSVFRIFSQIQAAAVSVSSLLKTRNDETRIAVVTFNDVQTIEFDFDDFSDINSINAALMGIQLDLARLPSTDIASAITFTVDSLFTNSRGYRGGLPVIVVISDDTAVSVQDMDARATAHTAGAYVVVLEIDQDIVEQDLANLATFPRLAFESDAASATTIASDIVTEISNLDVCFSSVCRKDVVVMIDTSGSTRQGRLLPDNVTIDASSLLPQVVDFVADVINHLPISFTESRVALLLYDAVTELRSDFSFDKAELLETVQNLTLSGALRNSFDRALPELALNVTATLLESVASVPGARDNDVIIVSDGEPKIPDATILEDAQTRIFGLGAEIFVVGLKIPGRIYNSTILDLLSNASENSFEPDSSTDYGDIPTQLSNRVCDITNAPSTSPTQSPTLPPTRFPSPTSAAPRVGEWESFQGCCTTSVPSLTTLTLSSTNPTRICKQICMLDRACAGIEVKATAGVCTTLGSPTTAPPAGPVCDADTRCFLFSPI
eukprot:m.90334 g.90334  ORF g.90334 m.90334 type:complete len:719 (-) comp26387_c0_seq1:582-2738(-)